MAIHSPGRFFGNVFVVMVVIVVVFIDIFVAVVVLVLVVVVPVVVFTISRLPIRGGEGGIIILSRKSANSSEPNIRWTSDQSLHSSLSIVVK